MSKFDPSAYSQEALKWPSQAVHKEQVLGSKLAEAGMLIQDILSPLPTRRVQGEDPSEGRRCIFEDVAIFYDGSMITSDIYVSQVKKPQSHDFFVVADFGFDSTPGRRATVGASWGVDNPENQKLYTEITDLQEDGERQVYTQSLDSEIEPYYRNFIINALYSARSEGLFEEVEPEAAKDFWELERDYFEREERCLAASHDPRMLNVVDSVDDVDNYPLDYQYLGDVLDEIERDHELNPIEVIQAYTMCEERKVKNLEEKDG